MVSREPMQTKKFLVKLGFSEVSVECGSKEEAIRLARKKLSDDMPWLYDVIHSADEEQFQVKAASEHDARRAGAHGV